MKKFRRFMSHVLWAFLSLIITMVIVFGAIYTYIELQLPDVAVLKDVRLQVPLRVYTRDGKLISQYGTKRRIPVPLKQVPQPLINAVLATEDARFYSHPGVDLISLFRAAKAVISSGRKVQGASTITMQVARNFFLTRKKTYSRKMKEILLALKIDKEFSKDKILELYLNKVYFGNRAYGVAAAAQVYYGKKLSELTLPEMAMLAGLPQAPSRNNPLRSPSRALKRRNHVLSRMLEVGFINKTTFNNAVKAPVTAKFHGQSVAVSAPYVAEMARQVLVAEYGKTAYVRGIKVYTTLDSHLQIAAARALQDGLLAYSKRHGYSKPTQNLGWPSPENRQAWEKALRKINTVDRIDPAAVLETGYQTVQALLGDGEVITIPWSGLVWARPALRHGYKGAAPKRASQLVSPGDVIWIDHTKRGWRLTQIPKVQGALISMNPSNGAIIALSGGFDYSLSNFNRVTQALRQPGSNFKPFLYSAALAKGFTLASVINDAPVVMRDTGENQLWRPRNDTLRFYGPTRLRIGLTKSRNLVSIRLLQAVGIKYVLNYLENFSFNPEKLPHTLSLALGTGTVTPAQIAAGYAVFANGGYHVVPYFIQKIVDSNDNIVFTANPAKACEKCITNTNPNIETLPVPMAKRTITTQNAYLMTKVMQGVIQTGTGRGAKVLGRHDLAGKTGTTNNQIDAWFSGFNSDVLTTVWVGFDDMTPLYEYGAQAALPIWIQYMRAALEGKPEHSMPEPPGIVTVRIDPTTGLLANPDQSHAIFEVFRKQYEPKTFAQNTSMSSAVATATAVNASSGSASAAPNGETNDADEPLF